MELSSFSENIVTETFDRNGEQVELQINIDAVVPDYYDVLDQRLAPLTKEIDSLQAEWDSIQRVISKNVSEAERVEGLERANRERAQNKLKPKKITPADITPVPSLLPLQKRLEEVRREAFAERLTCPVMLPDGSFTCLLKGWSITEGGSVIPASKENLLRLPPKAVEELWERCIKRATTTVKKTEDEAVTSDNTQDGSPGLRVVGQSA